MVRVLVPAKSEGWFLLTSLSDGVAVHQREPKRRTVSESGPVPKPDVATPLLPTLTHPLDPTGTDNVG